EASAVLVALEPPVISTMLSVKVAAPDWKRGTCSVACGVPSPPHELGAQLHGTGDHVPTAGSKSSAEATAFARVPSVLPPETNTLPLGSNAPIAPMCAEPIAFVAIVPWYFGTVICADPVAPAVFVTRSV